MQNICFNDADQVGLYPIVTFQYSSTTLIQVSYHIQYLFFQSDNRILPCDQASGGIWPAGGWPRSPPQLAAAAGWREALAAARRALGDAAGPARHGDQGDGRVISDCHPSAERAENK